MGAVFLSVKCMSLRASAHWRGNPVDFPGCSINHGIATGAVPPRNDTEDWGLVLPDWPGNHPGWSAWWCSAQRIKNPLIAGGNHTLIQVPHALRGKRDHAKTAGHAHAHPAVFHSAIPQKTILDQLRGPTTRVLLDCRQAKCATVWLRALPGYFANSLFFSQVAMMASVIAERKPPFSRARTPWMVEPPGEQTASFILPGWSPL